MKFVEMKIKNRLTQIGITFSESAEQQVATRFLEAVMLNPDDAWAFVSKVYAFSMGLDELREILGAGAQIKVSDAFYLNTAKNCQTRSIYVENAEINLKRLLHLRMVKDGGAWKICGVEQEECRKI